MVVNLAQSVFVLEADAVVDGQARARAPIVLDVEAPVLREPLALAVVERHGSVRGETEQQAGELVSARAALARERRIERERAAQRALGCEGDADPAEVRAELEAVGADQPRERAVDRIGTLPAHRNRSPSADALR